MTHDERTRQRLLRWVGIGYDPRRLPGKLADETTETVTTRCAHCAAPIKFDYHPDGSTWLHQVAPADGHAARPVCAVQAEAGPHEVAHDDTPDIQATAEDLAQWSAYLDRRDTSTGRPALHGLNGCRRIEDRYLAVCQQLRETTADRDRLSDAVDRRDEQIRGLEETVRAYAAHHSPRRMAMHGADDRTQVQPAGTEAGR